MKIGGTPGAAAVGQQAGMSDQDLAIKIEEKLEKSEIGSWKGIPLREPPCVDNLKPMLLDKTYAFMMQDHTQIDYPERTAFVDQANSEFFLKVTGHTGDLGPKPEFWFGPFGLDA